MAFYDSSSSTFQLDDTGGTQRNLSAYVTAIRGLPGPRNLNDVTSLSDSGRKSIPGLEDVQFSVDFLWDDTATSGPDVVLSGVRTHTAAVDFEYSPEGTTVYSGTCWITSYEINSQVGSQVTATANFQVEGTVSRA